MPITKPSHQTRQAVLEAFRHAIAMPAGETFWLSAAREGVLALLWQRLEAAATDMDRQTVAPHLRQQATRFLQCQQATRQALAVAARHDIPVICLRGQALAQGLYGSPLLRPQSDVDILVNPAHLERLSDALLADAFQPVPSCPALFRHGQILLDVHVDPIGIARIAARAHMTSLRATDFFRHATPGTLCGQPVLYPASEIMLPYLCLHALKHSFDRLIWLWDIALLAQRISEEGEWQEVQAGIVRFQLQRPCFFALSYVRRHMDASVPEALLHAIRPDMDWREQSLLARFLAHDIPPYLAERMFARMIPETRRRLDFWRETIFPAGEVRQQFSGTSDCAGCNFIRDRLGRMLRLCGQAWGEAVALLRYR